MENTSDDRCISLSCVSGDGIFNITANNVTKIVQDENALLLWFHEPSEGEAWDMEFIFDDEEDATISRELLEKQVRLTFMKRIK